VAYDEGLADRIRVAVQGADGVTEMKMFGGLAFLLNGNMAVAASGQGGLMVRVEPSDTEALVREPGAAPFEMRGRPMDGWLRVEASAVDSDEALDRWVKVGVDYAGSLPPK
jgi:TfoX/Sxy family transcriptional regulator of competence genes